MKKIFTKLMLLAVAAAALVSCENNFDEQTPSVELTQTVTLSADKTAVRTELIEGVPYWSKNDQIGVYYTTGVDGEGKTTYENKAFTNDNEEATRTTSFTGTTAVVNTLFVYYPYVAGSDVINSDGVVKANLTSNQSPTATSFDGAADIMIAKPVTLDDEGKQLSDLEFARLGAIVKIVLKDKTGMLEGQSISKLTMTAATDLTGKVYLDVINQKLGTLYYKEKYVSATYTSGLEINGENATYVVVYPQTLAAGSELTFAAETSSGDYTISRTLTIPAEVYPDGIVLESGKVTTLNVSLNDGDVKEVGGFDGVDNAYNLILATKHLKVGDKVVIVAKGYDKALSTKQNSNNRGAADVTKNDDNTVDILSDVEVLTVEAGKTDGTFAFKTADGKYLYAASSSSNYLRSEATLSDNSSWAVNITEEGVASVVAQGSNTANVLKYNNNNTIFSCYASGQLDISIYKLVGEYVIKAPAITLSVADVTVEHDATSGNATVTATNGDGWAITAATEATWVKNLNYAEGKIAFTTEANEGEARSATVTVTATKADYDNVTATFKISQNAKPAAGEEVKTWTLLTNASDLAVGDQIIIASSSANYAISTTQNSNNRGQAAITKSSDKNTLSTPGATVQILTVEAGSTSGSFAFYAAAPSSTVGYLYAAGASSNNYMRTQTTVDDKASWTVSIASTGVATIKCVASISKNWMRYNSSSGIFSCYNSGQGEVVIYKLVGGESGGEGGGSTPEEPETPATPVLTITTTSPIAVVAEGDVATVKYTVTNPVSGKSVTASANQTWVNSFDYSVAGEVSFAVDANTGDAREATVTLSYDGATAQTIKISQAAGNTGGGETTKTATFTFTGSNGQKDTLTFTSGDITLTVTKNGSSNAPYDHGDKHLRAYNKNKLTFSGGTITSVVMTATSSTYARTWDNASVSGSTITWTGSATSVALTNTSTSQARITEIVVTYK